MAETREEKETRRRAQCQANAVAWAARHESMLKVPASYFFDILETYLVDGEQIESPFDIAEIIVHLRERFPDDLRTISITEETH